MRARFDPGVDFGYFRRKHLNAIARTFGGMIRLIMEVPALTMNFVNQEPEVKRKFISNAPSGCVKALDELLDLPHLNILLSLILTHCTDVLGLQRAI